MHFLIHLILRLNLHFTKLTFWLVIIEVCSFSGNAFAAEKKMERKILWMDSLKELFLTVDWLHGQTAVWTLNRDPKYFANKYQAQDFMSE